MLPHNEAELDQLTTAFDEGQLTICVGPELARMGGLPTPPMLARALLRTLIDERPQFDSSDIRGLIDEGKYAEALAELEYELSTPAFRSHVVRAYGDQRSHEPPALAMRIAGLRDRLHSVFTTNLDGL